MFYTLSRPCGTTISLHAFFCVLLLSYSLPAAGEALQNITITVPLGTTNHGNEHLFCTPAKWSDLTIFFLANYVAHAATVRATPGESFLSVLLNSIAALVFPFSGVMRGFGAVLQHAVTYNNPLETASKAGALCVIERTEDWEPQVGDKVGVKVGRTPAITSQVGRHHSSRENLPVDNPNNGTETPIRPGASNQRINGSNHDKLNLLQDNNGVAIVTIGRTALRDRSTFTSSGLRDWPTFISAGLSERQIHGICNLPLGYTLSVVHSRTRLRDLEGKEVPAEILKEQQHWWRKSRSVMDPETSPASLDAESKPEDICRSTSIASVYSFSKGIIAIFQTVYASMTLFQTRGSQISRYGYAAYGLTVVPYLLMSVINLLGTLLTPDYPTMYLVRSEVMVEAARREGAKFEGVVGELIENDQEHITFTAVDGKQVTFDHSLTRINANGQSHDTKGVEGSFQIQTPPSSSIYYISPAGLSDAEDEYSLHYSWVGSFLVFAIDIAIIGGISHFHKGQSTLAQRVWTMSWLVVGISAGVGFQFISQILGPEASWLPFWFTLFRMTPAIGGFVVVGQMLRAYGSCIRLF